MPATFELQPNGSESGSTSTGLYVPETSKVMELCAPPSHLTFSRSRYNHSLRLGVALEDADMSAAVKIYKVKDFIRKTEAGNIDFDRSMEIIHDLAIASSFHTDHNILIDMRETTLVDKGDMSTLLQLAVEMVRYQSVFKGKIANVVPSDENRLSIARQFKACLDIKGFHYEIFTSFEDAINWLSEITEANPGSP
jgi:hypothetical protein